MKKEEEEGREWVGEGRRESEKKAEEGDWQKGERRGRAKAVEGRGEGGERGQRGKAVVICQFFPRELNGPVLDGGRGGDDNGGDRSLEIDVDDSDDVNGVVRMIMIRMMTPRKV